MIKFCSLYSGSSGNSYFLEIDGVKTLVDSGKSGKKIIEGLKTIGEDIKNIEAIIVTHEHKDHVQSLKMLSKKYDIKIVISEGTYIMMEEQLNNIEKENIITFKTGSKFKFKNIDIKSIKIPHDAADPSAFSFFDCENKKITIATDIGNYNDYILENIKGSDILLLESNYEENILRVSRYPYYLKQRIAGPYGHLSNNKTKEIVEMLLDTNIKQIILGHLSKENNTEYIAYDNIYNVLKSAKKHKKIGLEVAKREEQSNMYILKNNKLEIKYNYDTENIIKACN